MSSPPATDRPAPGLGPGGSDPTSPKDAPRATRSGIPLEPWYVAAPSPDAAPDGPPGECPYTRGIHPEMYRTRLRTQSLHVNAYDEALSLPSEVAARIAIRTHQIIAHESGVPHVADPLGGSHLVESLTARIEEEVEAYLARIAEQGGVLRGVERGFFQREIARSAYAQQLAVESGERVVVGVNHWTLPGDVDAPAEVFAIDEAEEERQRERVRRVRASRSQPQVAWALDRLRDAARGSDNLMPSILDAVRAYATMGEITGVLAEVFGRHRETAVLA
jgi:methylmalonyl-CoA mutase N-terminal domain/subunit